MTTQVNNILPYRVCYLNKDSGLWYEFIKYETKIEAINYIEKINPKERPAIITKGEQTLRAYDSGIIDYEDIRRDGVIIAALRNRHYSALIAMRDHEKEYPEIAEKYQFLADELEKIIKAERM